MRRFWPASPQSHRVKIKVIVNMYRGGSEKSHLKKFHHLLFRYIRIRNNLSFLGLVHFDKGIPSSVQAIKPFLSNYPRNRAAKYIVQVANNLADDYNDLRRRWFDRWLKGMEHEAVANSPVKVFVMGGGDGSKDAAGRLSHGGCWRDEQEWPLARTGTAR